VKTHWGEKVRIEETAVILQFYFVLFFCQEVSHFLPFVKDIKVYLKKFLRQ